MEHIGIVDFCRSPISKAKDGGLNQLSILEIATRVVRALLDRNPAVPRDLIEVVAAGCAFPEAEAGFNIGRCISVKAGLPAEVAGLTLNQFCGSSQTTVALIADMLAVGKGKIGIAVGLEHMKHIPMGGFNPLFDKELSEMNFYIGMGDTAENLAKELQISREDQEAYSMYSHEKALAAWASGAFDREVIPMSLPDGSTLIKDECPMPPNPEKMRSLSPAFDIKGSVTAATSSPVTSGAGAALIMTEGMAKELGLSLRATIVTTAMAGCDWTRMTITSDRKSPDSGQDEDGRLRCHRIERGLRRAIPLCNTERWLGRTQDQFIRWCYCSRTSPGYVWSAYRRDGHHRIGTDRWDLRLGDHVCRWWAGCLYHPEEGVNS